MGGKKNFILYIFFVLRGSLVDILFVQLAVVTEKKKNSISISAN